MNWDFERYANVEILDIRYTVICQTAEDLMKVKKSNMLTMFLDDKTEMANVVTKPNERIEYCQTSASLLCGSMKEQRC